VQRLKEQAREALRVGDFDQAEELLNQAKAHDLSAIERMGPDLDARKLSAAEAAAQNGDLMMTQIRYADAARYYAEAVGLTPETRLPAADILNNLALLYRATGRYAQAELLYQRALAIGEKTLGPEHPTIASMLNNLALLYRATGRYAQAEPLHQRALAIDEKALGPEHPGLATDLNNLAELHQATGRYAQAEPLFQRAIAILDKSLPPDHPNLATARENYAILLDALGRGDEATALRTEAAAIRQRREQAQAPP
jgi:tetratricopeptide (TPR) repeat protein